MFELARAVVFSMWFLVLALTHDVDRMRLAGGRSGMLVGMVGTSALAISAWARAAAPNGTIPAIDVPVRVSEWVGAAGLIAWSSLIVAAKFRVRTGKKPHAP
ncbi:MAG: hypothetical protein GX446_16305 [Chthonomonadales bacterium]|nr:hypothetical protein [Chthonomonadales bacterium]